MILPEKSTTLGLAPKRCAFLGSSLAEGKVNG
jgi:hypothetical protein